MKTVHVISSGEYSDYRVLAVVEDEATATAWADSLRNEPDGYHSDARVELMPFIPSGTAPAKQHFVCLTENLWDDGKCDHYHVDEEDEYAIGSYRGEAPLRPLVRFVRALIHEGRGGRIEISGRTLAAVLKVYSEQKAVWKSSPKTFRAS